MYCVSDTTQRTGSMHKVVTNDMQAEVLNTLFINKDIIDFPKNFYSCDIFNRDLMLQGF